MSFAPRADYSVRVAWARYVFGSFFTIGVSMLDGPDVFAASMFSETFGGEHDDISADVIAVRGRHGRQGGPGTDVTAGEYTVELHDHYVDGLEEPPGKYDPLNPDSPLAGNLEPLRAFHMEADYDGTTRSIYYGFVRSGESKPGPRKSVANLEVTDLFLWLSDCHPIMMATGPTTTGAVIGLMLDEVGWTEPAMRDLDVGDDIPSFETDGSISCLQAIAQVLETERGIFYIHKSGMAVYESRYAYASKVSMGEVEAGLTRLGSGFSLDEIRNRAVVVAAGGDPQFAVDAASVAKFGFRDFDPLESELLASDEQALGLAEYLVWRYGSSLSTLWELRIDNRTDELLDMLLGLCVQDRITVTNPLTAVSSDFLIEGIQEELIVQTGRHTLTMVLSPFPTVTPFVIGSSTLSGPDSFVY